MDNTANAFAALERIINAAAQDQYSADIIQNARAGLDALRAELADWKQWKDVREAISNIETLGSIAKGEPHTQQLQKLCDERDLWQQRSNLQFDITRAAGQRGYRISAKEFEDLQRAVETYKQLAEQEAATAATPTE